MKIPDFAITVPLRKLADKLFGNKEPVPIEPTPDAPEYAEANQQLQEINQDIRDQEGLDVKTLRDMLKR